MSTGCVSIYCSLQLGPECSVRPTIIEQTTNKNNKQVTWPLLSPVTWSLLQYIKLIHYCIWFFLLLFLSLLLLLLLWTKKEMKIDPLQFFCSSWETEQQGFCSTKRKREERMSSKERQKDRNQSHSVTHSSSVLFVVVVFFLINHADSLQVLWAQNEEMNQQNSSCSSNVHKKQTVVNELKTEDELVSCPLLCPFIPSSLACDGCVVGVAHRSVLVSALPLTRYTSSRLWGHSACWVNIDDKTHQ